MSILIFSFSQLNPTTFIISLEVSALSLLISIFVCILYGFFNSFENQFSNKIQNRYDIEKNYGFIVFYYKVSKSAMSRY